MKFLFFIIFTISSAHACPLLDRPSDFSLPFRQTRQIAGIRTPIVSSGNFSLRVGKRVVWETLSPFYSKVVISKAGFRVQDQIYSAGPMKHLSSILLKLYSGNLEQEFSFKCEKRQDQKFLLLVVPKKEELLRLIKQVEIIGVNSPERINFTDARGDKTQVEFEK